MKSQTVYVLIHRLELAEHGNQTESAEPYLFETEEDAIEKACEIMRDETSHWGWNKEEQDAEAEDLADELRSTPRGGRAYELVVSHFVQLTDSDNEVFELYRRGIAPKGSLNPTV